MLSLCCAVVCLALVCLLCGVLVCACCVAVGVALRLCCGVCRWCVFVVLCAYDGDVEQVIDGHMFFCM